MANERTFHAQKMTTNSVAIGGLSTFGLTVNHGTTQRSSGQGYAGIPAVDKVRQQIAAQLATTDVAKINSLLGSTPGDTVFYEKNSGDANYTKRLLATADGSIVWLGASIDFRTDEDAVLTLDGEVQFAGAAKTVSDVFEVDSTVDSTAYDAVAITVPTRQYRPKNASFDPGEAAGGDEIAMEKVVSARVSLRAAHVGRESLEDDVGVSVIDIMQWGDPQIVVTVRHAFEVATDTSLGAKLIDAGIGTFTMDMMTRGGADVTLTCNGIQWTDYRDNHRGAPPGYCDTTLTGAGQWYRGDLGVPVTYTLSNIIAIA